MELILWPIILAKLVANKLDKLIFSLVMISSFIKQQKGLKLTTGHLEKTSKRKRQLEAILKIKQSSKWSRI